MSLIADINFSNFFRRLDNFSPYRWALHGYLGMGLQSYKYYRKDNYPYLERGVSKAYAEQEFSQALDQASFFYQGGLGLHYRLNKWIDLETRLMYVISGDDEFDGGGETPHVWPGYNLIKKNTSDNMVVANVGVRVKLGKKENEHLVWYDPMKELYYRTRVVEENLKTQVCENGDKDHDGVCDDWDRQLDTPIGARIDGAGVALDMDLDGIIDLHDKCVTVPGLAEYHGCPKPEEKVIPLVEEKPQYAKNDPKLIEEINRLFKGVKFHLDKFRATKAEVTPDSFKNLDKAAEIIKTLNPEPKYLVIGATDTRASELYNKILSKKRAESVKEYLIKRGVKRSLLFTEGRGEKDLVHPECNPASKCPEWKNEENRRVFFEEIK